MDSVQSMTVTNFTDDEIVLIELYECTDSLLLDLFICETHVSVFRKSLMIIYTATAHTVPIMCYIVALYFKEAM